MANALARLLRNNATPAEHVLWQQLELLKPEGRHFRRQVLIDHFVADFVCHYPKLVIELDGGQHSEAVLYDASRTAVLKRHGYKVLRFWNVDVFEALEGVVDRIRYEVRLPTMNTYITSALHSTPTPTVPTRGRE